MRHFVFFTIATGLVGLGLSSAKADALNTVLRWDVPAIGEDQVNNSMADPPGDGSTDSTASGWAQIEIKDNPLFLSGETTKSDEEYLIRVTLNWSGLEGDLTKIHIHGWLDPMGNPIGPHNSTPTHLYEIPGLETEANTIASGVDRRSDTYALDFGFLPHAHPFDDPLDTITPTQIIDEFVAGRAYINVHSSAHPMGEIRGNLTAVPEPSSVGQALLAILVGWRIVGSRRRR